MGAFNCKVVHAVLVKILTSGHQVSFEVLKYPTCTTFLWIYKYRLYTVLEVSMGFRSPKALL